MAAGRPVIATAHGGPVEIVDAGRTGILVEPRNPHAMAEAIVRLAADPDRASDMGRAGRDRVLALYGIDRTVERLQVLYEEVLAD
jgi:glycosyltransferase involved in cell wall biosynthesis